jgi:hypothetical protein
MDAPDGELPRIPDDWSREIMRANPKSTSTNSNKSTTGGTSSNNMLSGGETPAIVRKRKRNVSTCSSTSITPKPKSTNVDVTNSHTDDSMKSQSSKVTPVATITPNHATPAVAPTSASSQRHCDETESVMKGLYYQVEKLARRPGCALKEGIYLDSIMTHIPYTDVLEQMFGGNDVTDSACVPVVTRAYEESYMRETMDTGEEPCIMGSNCECQFVDEHNPFIGVQFTLPVEAFSSSSATNSMIEELSSNKLCVLCCRKNTQSLFYEALYNHRAYTSCIQLYGNICDRPGEYAKEAMLICPLSGPVQNMPLPVVAHQRNRYSIVDYNGIRQLRQHRVGYEDFHMPSSSRC